MALCLGLRATSYVELGCGSSHEQARVGMRVVTVDVLPNGMPTIAHVQGDSHDFKTLMEVRLRMMNEWKDDTIDIVFIDADHSEAAVEADFNLWWPVARLAVGFHDILMPGVQEFWERICQQHPSVQIIGRDIASAEAWQHNSSSLLGCGGIGVLFKM